MKLHAALCFLLFAGCATAPSLRAMNHVEALLDDGGGGPGGSLQEGAESVRMETPAGTFLVSPKHADDFARALAGEPTPTPFFAGAD